MLNQKVEALKRSYNMQRYAAKKRNVDFRLSFDEWLDLWVSSGKLDKRGRGRGKYCMARFNDSGPYATYNVQIIKHTKNTSDAHYNDRAPIRAIKMSIAMKGRKWNGPKLKYTFHGRTLTSREWSALAGVTIATFHYRINRWGDPFFTKNP